MGFQRLRIQGIGLHTGRMCSVTLRQAERGRGIEFRRINNTEMKGRIPASISHVTSSLRATTLGMDNVSVGMVEHLLSAIACMGVADLVVEVDGPEIPILDGSAAPWALAFNAIGAAGNPRWTAWKTPVEFRRDKALVRIEPDDHFSIDATVEFPEMCLGRQQLTWHFNQKSYLADIAPARTLGRLNELENLLSQDLIKGGSLGCALVASENEFLNPEGARFSNETVRHRIVDATGDIYLKTAPALPLARFTLEQAGHAHLIEALNTV